MALLKVMEQIGHRFMLGFSQLFDAIQIQYEEFLFQIKYGLLVGLRR